MALVIRPLLADFEKDIFEFPSEMIAYCTFTIRNERKYTDTYRCDSNCAIWKDEIIFDVNKTEDNLWVQFWVQQGNVAREIAEGTVDLKRHYNKVAFMQKEYMDLKKDDRYIGKLVLTIQYITLANKLKLEEATKKKKEVETIAPPVIVTQPAALQAMETKIPITKSEMIWQTQMNNVLQMSEVKEYGVESRLDDPAGLFGKNTTAVGLLTPAFEPSISNGNGLWGNNRSQENNPGRQENPEHLRPKVPPQGMSPQQYQQYMQEMQEMQYLEYQQKQQAQQSLPTQQNAHNHQYRGSVEYLNQQTQRAQNPQQQNYLQQNIQQQAPNYQNKVPQKQVPENQLPQKKSNQNSPQPQPTQMNYAQILRQNLLEQQMKNQPHNNLQAQHNNQPLVTAPNPQTLSHKSNQSQSISPKKSIHELPLQRQTSHGQPIVEFSIPPAMSVSQATKQKLQREAQEIYYNHCMNAAMNAMLRK